MSFKPTLACDAPKNITFPVFASPKLDGIRCSIVHGKALSRTLKEIPNRVIFDSLSKTEYTGLDGELIVGSPTTEDVYRNTVSGVMSHDGNPEFTYHVFDLHNARGGWHARYQALYESFNGGGIIQPLQHEFIERADDLDAYEAEQLAAGYEGLILRKPDAPYKFGRLS